MPITQSQVFASTDAFLYADTALAVPAPTKNKVFRNRHRVIWILCLSGSGDVDSDPVEMGLRKDAPFRCNKNKHGIVEQLAKAHREKISIGTNI